MKKSQKLRSKRRQNHSKKQRQLQRQRGGGSSDWQGQFYNSPQIPTNMDYLAERNHLIAQPDSNYLRGDNFAKLNDPFSMVAAPYPMASIGGGSRRRGNRRGSRNRQHGGGASQWGANFYSWNDPSAMSVKPHDAERLWRVVDDEQLQGVPFSKNVLN
jgi:hypothetical protein